MKKSRARLAAIRKKVSGLKNWQKLLTGLVLVIILTMSAEIFCNRSVLGLSADERGIQTVSAEKIEATGYDRSEDGYYLAEDAGKIHIDLEGRYVDKFLYDYDYEGLLDMKVTVQYHNAFGQTEVKSFIDKNSAVIRQSVINLGKKVDWIELYTDEALLLENGVSYLDLSSYPLTITGFSVKNEIQFNYIRMLCVFLGGCLAVLLVTFRKLFAQKLEYAFLITALVLGILMIACLPATKVGWDEEAHFMRVYQMSLFPGGKEVTAEFPELFVCGIDTWPLNLPASLEERQEIDQFFDETCTEGEKEAVVNGSLSGIYTSGYMVPAAFLKVGRFLGMPFSLLYQFGRFGNLLMYCVVMMLAIRFLPVGKRILMAVGLMPTPMFLACCYSYDPSVTAFSMLGFALLLREIIDKNREFSWKSYLAAMFCLAWGILPKAVYAPLVLTGLMIPASKFKNKKEKWLVRIGIIFVFLALMSSFVLPSLLSPSSYGDTRGGDVSVGLQMKYILSHPFAYIGILISNIWKSLPSYLMGQDVFRILGHWGVAGFGSVTMIYICAVIMAEDSAMKSRQMTGWQKLGLFLITACCIVLIWTAFYLTFTVPGSSEIQGVQGRYFLPLLLPLFLLFGCRKIQLQISEQAKNLWVTWISGGLFYIVIWTQMLMIRNW